MFYAQYAVKISLYLTDHVPAIAELSVPPMPIISFANDDKSSTSRLSLLSPFIKWQKLQRMVHIHNQPLFIH